MSGTRTSVFMSETKRSEHEKRILLDAKLRLTQMKIWDLEQKLQTLKETEFQLLVETYPQ
jgi:hypothetical protein